MHSLLFFFFCIFVSKIILFQKALKFKKSIIFYYNKQSFVKMNARVPPPLTWHISEIIVDYFGPIVSAYILNQSRNH